MRSLALIVAVVCKIQTFPFSTGNVTAIHKLLFSVSCLIRDSTFWNFHLVASVFLISYAIGIGRINKVWGTSRVKNSSRQQHRGVLVTWLPNAEVTVGK